MNSLKPITCSLKILVILHDFCYRIICRGIEKGSKVTKTTTKKNITPNLKQQECIDNINGKYLVLAGPGTGKTFTIIQRIKNMLQKGVQPEKILCLTFTDAAANEMKKRIEQELNVLSTEVNIFTYHGFCSKILDEYSEDFELPANYKIVTDSITKAFIKDCIDEINPVYFRTEKNDPYYYIKTIKSRISKIKQNRISKEQYFKNLEENPDWSPNIKKWEDVIEDVKSGKNKRYKAPPFSKRDDAVKKVNQAKELWEFYELFQEKMNSQNYLDFSDMINLVLDKFETNPGFLTEVANEYEYILVDEYQDTNKSQNDIVFALTHALQSENVFVVGDDDQIIYRFQGAKLDTVEKFLEEFPQTHVICLEENMRSTQHILDAARELVKQDPLSLINNPRFKDYNISKNLIAKNEELFSKNKPVRCYKYADQMQEYTEIIDEIEGLINSEECPQKDGHKKLSEIAIFAKSNAELEEFAQMLKSRNIPYELKEGKNIFKISAVNVLYMYIKTLINPDMYFDRLFQLLLCHPFCLNSKDYLTIFENKSKCKTILDSIKQIPETDFSEPQKIKEFLETFDYLKHFKIKENIKNTILEIGTKTGIFDYYINDDINRTENIAGLKKFLDEAEGFSGIYKSGFLEDFVEYLDAIIKDEDKINTDKAPVTLNAVQLSTYHSSKGREFEYVYMPSLHQYNWESGRNNLTMDIPLPKDEYKNDDEMKEMKYSDLIKLLYVGMTRAKHTLRLSFPETVERKNRKLTKFVADIQNIFEHEKEPFEYDETSYWTQAGKLLIKRNYDYKREFHTLVDAQTKDKAFSATSINQYLKCPRQFLYERILKLKGKDGNPNNLSYGSAVHKACEEAILYAKKNNAYPSKETFIEWFKQELNRLPMESYQQRQNYLGRGEKALEDFYPILINTPISRLVAAEMTIEDDGTVFEGIKFTGSIDRVDKNDDGTFTIYDYKTGNNKNSAIKIGGEHEDYYNQIAFYKYYYEKLTGNKVSETKFIYPEDFESKNNAFLLTDEECEEIAKKIQTVVNKIHSYEFEPSYDKNVCKYCTYRDFCNLDTV